MIRVRRRAARVGAAPGGTAVKGRNWRLWIAVPACLALAGTMAACGSSTPASSKTTGTTSGSGSSGLPATIHLYSIQDASGAVAVVGKADEQGMNLAIQQINKTHFLGSSKLSISYGDDASTPTQASNLATAAATAHYPVVIGPPLSSTAEAVASILARNTQLLCFTQAGGTGTILNKYTFRLTPLQKTTAMPVTMKYLQSKNIKTVGVIYDTTVPTLVALKTELATTGSKYGFKVTVTAGVTSKQSDISSAVTKVIGAHPDAVAVLFSPPQTPTAATELKQGGFNGIVFGNEGSGGGALKGAGATANGFVWATDWNPGAPFGSVSTAFTKLYRSTYGTTANDWNAENYTLIYFIARGLKAAGSTTKTKLDQALIAEGKNGYAGVLGKDIKVKNGQMITPGVLVQWKTGKAVSISG